MKTSLRASLCAVALVAIAGAGPTVGGRVANNPTPVEAPGAASQTQGFDVPLVNWMAPQLLHTARGIGGTLWGTTAGTASRPAMATTAVGNAFEVKPFVPITPCRLVDTRGAFSPVYAGGPYAAGETRTYRAAGNCGVVAGTNTIDAVSIAITTPPTAASGDIEAIAANATLGSTVAMVIQAGQWNSVTVVSRVDANGDFKVQLRGTPGDVVIDINGFYASADPANAYDSLFVNGQYASDGAVFLVTNASAAGGAIRGSNAATGADAMLASGHSALDIRSGSIRVRNAGVDTNTAVFVHRVTADNSCVLGGEPHTVLDHPDLNGNPNAIVHAGAAMFRYPGGSGTGGADWDKFNVIYYWKADMCGTVTAQNKWTLYKRAPLTAFVLELVVPILVVLP